MLMESYGRVFALAAKYHAGHVVFHYSQKQFAEDTRQQAQDNAYAVMKKLTATASEQGVFCVIEISAGRNRGSIFSVMMNIMKFFNGFPRHQR